jgi:hypothetical protein
MALAERIDTPMPALIPSLTAVDETTRGFSLLTIPMVF